MRGRSRAADDATLTQGECRRSRMKVLKVVIVVEVVLHEVGGIRSRLLAARHRLWDAVSTVDRVRGQSRKRYRDGPGRLPIPRTMADIYMLDVTPQETGFLDPQDRAAAILLVPD